MMKQFFDFDVDAHATVVKEGDTFSSGEHVFHFVMAPMDTGPDAMVTYEEKTKILFSADGFGTFGALNGNIFADEVDFDRDWLDEREKILYKHCRKIWYAGAEPVKESGRT